MILCVNLTSRITSEALQGTRQTVALLGWNYLAVNKPMTWLVARQRATLCSL